MYESSHSRFHSGISSEIFVGYYENTLFGDIHLRRSSIFEMFRTCEYLNIIPLTQKLCWVLSEWLLYSEGRIPRVPTPNSSLKTCRCPLAGEGVIWVTEYRNWTLVVWPVDTLVDNLCKLQSHKGYQNVIFFCHKLGRQVILPAAPQLFGVFLKHGKNEVSAKSCQAMRIDNLDPVSGITNHSETITMRWRNLGGKHSPSISDHPSNPKMFSMVFAEAQG